MAGGGGRSNTWEEAEYKLKQNTYLNRHAHMCVDIMFSIIQSIVLH